MMNILGFLIGVVTALSMLISSCGPISSPGAVPLKNEESHSSQAKVALTEKSINGHWESRCVLDDERYRRDTLDLTLPAMEWSTTYYADANCNSPLFQRSFLGEANLKDSKILLNYSSMAVLPLTTIYAVAFNQFNGYCNMKEWKVGTLRSFVDVTQCREKATREFIIERYGADELFLGDQKFMKSDQ